MKYIISLIMCVVVAGVAAADDRPNIILLMGDDHGWDETGYNGHPHLKTPVLDEMAASGLRLDHFYAASPVCSPTRGSVMTGRHPNRYGTFVPNFSIRPEEITLAQILKDAGYVSAHFGKWHLGPVKAESPTNPGAMGFDQWLSHDNFFEMNPFLSRNGGVPVQWKGESSQILIDEAIHFLESTQQNDQPAFVVVWFGSPHEPYSGLDEDLALYDDLPEAYRDQQVSLTSMTTGQPTRRPLNEMLRERYAEITAMDRAIGHLRDYLASADIKDNTLIWYCGDNGTPAGGIITSPFRGLKATLYEGGIRVPGIIEWPAGIPEPRSSDVNAVTSDMLPTICELLSLSLPDRPLDGVSLKPLIEGNMTERPSPLCFWNFDMARVQAGDEPWIARELQTGTTPLVKMMDGRFTRNFRNHHYAAVAEEDFGGPRVILDGDLKLVLDAAEPGSVELFDLHEDRSESHNLANSRPADVETLQGQLREWQESVLHSLTGADYESDRAR